MPQQATFDDANLILRLFELRREARMREGRRWFVKCFAPTTMAEYHALCPLGSEENEFARMVITFNEMTASFITSGVLNADLYFASGGELGLVYARIEPLLAEMRQAMGNPGIYKNLEQAGKLYAQFVNRNDPGAWDAFSARVKGMVKKA